MQEPNRQVRTHNHNVECCELTEVVMTAVNIPTVMQYTVCEYACHVLLANQEHTLLTTHTHTHAHTLVTLLRITIQCNAGAKQTGMYTCTYIHVTVWVSECTVHTHTHTHRQMHVRTDVFCCSSFLSNIHGLLSYKLLGEERSHQS